MSKDRRTRGGADTVGTRNAQTRRPAPGATTVTGQMFPHGRSVQRKVAAPRAPGVASTPVTSAWELTTSADMDAAHRGAAASPAHAATSHAQAPVQARTRDADPERHESLPDAVMRMYGDRLGADFSRVRVHTGDGVAREHGADAVALGDDIHFEDGKYDPGSAEGTELIGHELAHTVQQGAVPASDIIERAGSTGEMEDEADQAAAAVAHGESFHVSMSAPQASQFQVAEPRTQDDQLGMDLDPERGSEEATPHDEPVIENPTERALAQAEAAPQPAEGTGAEAASSAPASSPAVPAPAETPQEAPAGAPAPESRAAVPADGADQVQAVPQAAMSAPAPAVEAPTPVGLAATAALQQSATNIAAPPVPTSREHADPAIGALAAAVQAESASHAEQVRQAAERVTASLHVRLAATQQRIRAAHQARVAELEAGLQADLQALDTARAQAVSAVHASKASQLQRLDAAKQQHVAELRASAEQHKQSATQAAAQARAGVMAHGDAEAVRAVETSRTREAEAQQPNEIGGGDAARTDAQLKADREISSKAAQGFETDAGEMSARSRQAASEFAAASDEQLAGFHAKIDETVPSVVAALEQHAGASRAGIERAAAESVSGIDALHGQTRAHLQQEHTQAVSDLDVQATALEHAAAAEVSVAINGFAPQALELVQAFIVSSARASDAVSDCTSADAASATADVIRADLGEAAGQAAAQFASIEQQELTNLDSRAAAGETSLAQLAQDARAASQQTAMRVASEIQRIQSEAGRLMAEGSATATGQMSEATAQAAAEMEQATGKFNTELAGAAEQARGDISAGVDRALAEQAANLGQVHAKKQEAQGQIGSKYDALRDEAEGRSTSEQESRGGQRGFWGSLVEGWDRLTSAVKNWFASTFGDWLGGFLYGLLTTIATLVIVVGVLLLIAATGPIGAAIAVGLAATLIVGSAGLGIYSRFQTFQAHNGRSPGLGEGTLLVLLGIGDVTGAPQIVEGLAGQRAFSNGHEMSSFEAGENVGTGIAQLAGIIVGVRSLKGGRAKAGGRGPEPVETAEAKAPDTPAAKAPETPETKAPETPAVKAPETPEMKAPETTELKAPEAKALETKALETPEVKPAEEKVPETTAAAKPPRTLDELFTRLSDKAKEGSRQQKELLSEKNFQQMENAYKTREGAYDVTRANKLFESKWMDEARFLAELEKRKPTMTTEAGEVPKSWEKFNSEHHAEFKARLREFRGNNDLEPTPKLRGGEGQLFLTETDPFLAMKRWFRTRVGDMAKSMHLLEQARAAVESNPKLKNDIDVVRFHERGSDWGVRDFNPNSVPLGEASSSSEAAAARARVIAELQSMKSKGTLPDILNNILSKIAREPPSDNIHWSWAEGKILIIDMQ
jgi:Domain of unknown function (DUF4157)